MGFGLPLPVIGDFLSKELGSALCQATTQCRFRRGVGKSELSGVVPLACSSGWALNRTDAATVSVQVAPTNTMPPVC